MATSIEKEKKLKNPLKDPNVQPIGGKLDRRNNDVIVRSLGIFPEIWIAKYA